MKATGIVRKIDELGRVVIPMELRKTFDLNEGTPMEIFVDVNGEIILKKYQPGCVICGRVDDIAKTICGKYICVHCVKAINA